MDKEEIADVSDMDFQEKARLIRSDPVTCALYFDHRFKELKATWNNTNEGPFGYYKVNEMYYRIEFQHRGSPHVHILVWLDGAPVFDPEKPESFAEVENFVDGIITSSSENPEVGENAIFQQHRCTHTCRRVVRGKTVCRFHAPFYPLDKTRILTPYSPIGEEIFKIRNQNKKLVDILSNMPEDIQTFEVFLQHLNYTLDEYLLVIRTNLTRNKIFIKRTPNDVRTNQYSPKILKLMRSNMDIQYVIDQYICIGYVVDYINKSNRGMSRLLRECTEDLRNGHFSIRQKLKKVGNAFYNGTEISA